MSTPVPIQEPPPKLRPGLWQELTSRVEVPLLAAMLLIVLAGGLFFVLADEVMEGGTRMVDETILLAMRNPSDPADPLGPPWLQEMGRDFTALGGIGVVGFVSVVASIYLILARRWSTLWLLLIVVTGSLFFNQLLKAGFNRTRPDLVPHGMVVYNASFPSGHAMLSASIYLTLGVLLARIQKQRSQALLIMATALLVTILVGISRVYLAVHWPSDVLAGWIAGSIWATLCWLVAWQLRQGLRTSTPPETTNAAKSNTTDGPGSEPKAKEDARAEARAEAKE